MPVTPEVKGKPVAFVNVADAGVPNAGATSVGEVDNTLLPEPVEDVTPVPPFATGKTPVTPEVKLTPVTEPLSVKFPELVTAPDRVNPLTVPVPPTEVTVPGGTAHVPSPRQNVLVVALVPLFRLPTGKLPVTPVARLTPVTAPLRVKFPELVTVPPSVIPLTEPTPATEVTVPGLLTGVAHVPSPRQNVLVDALVPLFRLPTGKLPVTLVAKLTKVVDEEPVPPELVGKGVPSAKFAK